MFFCWAHLSFVYYLDLVLFLVVALILSLEEFEPSDFVCMVSGLVSGFQI